MISAIIKKSMGDVDQVKRWSDLVLTSSAASTPETLQNYW